MTSQPPHVTRILVIDDIDETRHLLGNLLRGSGYDVDLASDEDDAIQRARFHVPDLILMCLGLGREQLIAIGQNIRREAQLNTGVAMVVFCVTAIPEGAELEVNENVYLTRPDNFDQIRALLGRLSGRNNAIA
jgi:DNA-binding response OmpR family regulator